MENKIFDPTFGVCYKALAIAHYLNNDVIYIPKELEYTVILNSSPFYNGRESGICISIKSITSDKEQMNIVFGEQRRSDYIFLDIFFKDTINCPSLQDFTEEDYNKRETFQYDKIHIVASKIEHKIKSYINALLDELKMAEKKKKESK